MRALRCAYLNVIVTGVIRRDDPEGRKWTISPCVVTTTVTPRNWYKRMRSPPSKKRVHFSPRMQIMRPQFPSELAYEICAHVYAACLLPDQPSLDPLVATTDTRVPTAHPCSAPAGHWPEPATRRTLASLCLVNHTWYEAAKPWLWHK